MKRREFFTLVGGAATLPLAARAQSRIYRVAFLTLEPDENAALLIGPMRSSAMSKAPTWPSRIDLHRATLGDSAALAEELVREAPTCWLPDGERLHQGALKAARSSIPIVFASGDPSPGLRAKSGASRRQYHRPERTRRRHKGKAAPAVLEVRFRANELLECC